jgi:hypothetical protein
MQIPLDFFLLLIKDFLKTAEITDAAKALSKHIEEAANYKDLIGTGESQFNLKAIFRHYIDTEPSLKKILKKKNKELAETYELVNKDEESEAEEEVKPKKKKDDKLLNKKKQRDAEPEDEEEIIAPKFIPTSNGERKEKVPFRRVDESYADNLGESLKDNTYEAHMKKTGNDYGAIANDRLRVERGKGFKKEKTKFKNKNTFGSTTISTEVRSIPLDTDTD